jgi:hypothetical protein
MGGGTTMIFALWAVALALAMQCDTTQSVPPKVSAEERTALVALYQATGGEKRVNHDGWLGPPGTECKWHGVLCGNDWQGPMAGKYTVMDLSLDDNGLAGRLPPEFGALRGLRILSLGGNAVKGPLPKALLEQSDDGLLALVRPRSLLHDVDEVRFKDVNGSVLCDRYRVRLTADGTVQTERERLREDPPDSRECYCECREGRTTEFDWLGRFLGREGFFEPHEPREPVMVAVDVGERIATAERGGKSYTILSSDERDSVGRWALSTMLDGIVARAQWSAPAERRACPANW